MPGSVPALANEDVGVTLPTPIRNRVGGNVQGEQMVWLRDALGRVERRGIKSSFQTRAGIEGGDKAATLTRLTSLCIHQPHSS